MPTRFRHTASAGLRSGHAYRRYGPSRCDQREVIRDALLATKDFEGATGHVVFDGGHQNVSPDTIHYVETTADLGWKTLDWK